MAAAPRTAHRTAYFGGLRMARSPAFACRTIASAAVAATTSTASAMAHRTADEDGMAHDASSQAVAAGPKARRVAITAAGTIGGP